MSAISGLIITIIIGHHFSIITHAILVHLTQFHKYDYILYLTVFIKVACQQVSHLFILSPNHKVLKLLPPSGLLTELGEVVEFVAEIPVRVLAAHQIDSIVNTQVHKGLGEVVH